ETLATREQALKIVLPKAAEFVAESKALTAEQRESLQKQSGLRFPESNYDWFLGKDSGKGVGYSVILNEIGKREYITFMVGIDPQGKVTDVVVMEYRESRGGEVKEQRFLKQFHGKRSSDALRVNQDIVNYTGATLSSQAIARGVKRALLLAKLFYGV